jgi:hypothetical protein
MYLRAISDELPGYEIGDGDPLIVGPFENQEQLDKFLAITGKYWRSDGAAVYSPEEYLKFYKENAATVC